MGSLPEGVGEGQGGDDPTSAFSPPRPRGVGWAGRRGTHPEGDVCSMTPSPFFGAGAGAVPHQPPLPRKGE